MLFSFRAQRVFKLLLTGEQTAHTFCKFPLQFERRKNIGEFKQIGLGNLRRTGTVFMGGCFQHKRRGLCPGLFDRCAGRAAARSFAAG